MAGQVLPRPSSRRVDKQLAADINEQIASVNSRSQISRAREFGDLEISRFGDLRFLGIWRSGDLGIWRSGDLEIWGSGDLEIWRSGDLEI
jgi:hypothetical protein